MLQSFKLALRAIWDNKTRAFLTMLGIIVGVASVIILVSLVNGYMRSVTDSFTSMGVDQIHISVTQKTSRVLSEEDVYTFVSENPTLIKAVTPVVSVQERIRNGEERLSAKISGISETYLSISENEILLGRNLSYADCKGNRRVCVLGYYTACTMFGTADGALGETVKIGDRIFRVEGVTKKQEAGESEEGGADDFCWIPYSQAAKMNGTSSVDTWLLTITEADNADFVTEKIEDFLFEIFRDEESYSVTANSSILDAMDEMIGMIEALLGGIAGISLLVAGVGVMNIMLVSVTERTREIGIRKAIGARKRTILTQFIMEALVTSSLGGIAGIALGCSLTGLIGTLIGIEAGPTFGAIVISFSVSVAIGLIFGFMPARRAAGLLPIEALRRD